MGKICSKINLFKKKRDLEISLIQIREKRTVPRIIEITRRKRSKRRRQTNKWTGKN